ncbi:hypothetical protein [Streptomyces swartbergensis]|uniref:hypothetical protein n=1 Tax=Streptomyces swartbergensis TaxID=487165 RepID=UPI003822091E
MPPLSVSTVLASRPSAPEMLSQTRKLEDGETLSGQLANMRLHLGMGQFMGRNRLVLAFGATHPALL